MIRVAPATPRCLPRTALAVEIALRQRGLELRGSRSPAPLYGARLGQEHVAQVHDRRPLGRTQLQPTARSLQNCGWPSAASGSSCNARTDLTVLAASMRDRRTKRAGHCQAYCVMAP